MVFSGKVFGMREEDSELAKEDPKAGAVELEEGAHGETLELPLELLAEMRTDVKAGGAPVETLEIPLELLAQMWTAVKAGGATAEDVSDSTLLRFLRVRGMSVPKASKLYLEDVKWRQVYLPVALEDVEADLRSGKAMVASKPGERPWVYMFAKHHDTNTRDMDTFRKFSVFLLERVVASIPESDDKFGAVMDLGDTQYRNLDARGMLAILEYLQAHYPERMCRLYFVHVPYIFWGLWKAVRPLVDQRIRQKIVFVEDTDMAKVLAKEIPLCLLPEELGGQAELPSAWEKYGRAE